MVCASRKDFNPTCNENCFVLTNVVFGSSGYQGGVTVPYNSTIQTKSNLFYNVPSVVLEPRVRNCLEALRQ